MAQFSYLLCLAIGFSEPAAEDTDRGDFPAALRDVPALLFGSERSLGPEGIQSQPEPPSAGLGVVIEYTKSHVDARRERDAQRRAKQLMVHLAPERVKIYSANLPPADGDLFDKPLPSNELAVLCDGMEEETLGSTTTWTFTGNVQLQASRFLIFCCHQATVTRTSEHLLLTVSGGRDYSDDLTGLDVTELQLSHPEGQVLLAGERAPEEPHDLAAASLFPSARIRVRLSDGKYLVRMGADATTPLNK